MSEYRNVRLPENVCAAAEKWLPGKFGDLETLLTFLLTETIKDEGEKLDQAEEEMVEQRLRDLGYI
jgi:hypothetical protein